MLTTVNQVFFLFNNGGVFRGYQSLPALYLKGTYWDRTSGDPLAVQIPQQPTFNAFMRIYFSIAKYKFNVEPTFNKRIKKNYFCRNLLTLAQFF